MQGDDAFSLSAFIVALFKKLGHRSRVFIGCYDSIVRKKSTTYWEGTGGLL